MRVRITIEYDLSLAKPATLDQIDDLLDCERKAWENGAINGQLVLHAGGTIACVAVGRLGEIA